MRGILTLRAGIRLESAIEMSESASKPWDAKRR